MLRRSTKYAVSLLIIAAFLAAFLPPVGTLTVLSILIAIFFLARNLGFGLLVLVFFFPYLGLVIDFGEFEAFREVLYLKDINAPFIDLYGLLLFVAWGLRRVYEFTSLRNYEYSQIRKFVISQFPFLKSYLLFWLSGLISLLRVPSIYFGTALKYLARPFTFFYLVFFVPVISILRAEGLLNRVLTVFYWTGLLSAVNGLLGLFFGAHEGFPRAAPFGLFGVSPLGPNHNLLAETLIATAPAGLLVRCQVSGVRCQNWIRYGMLFQWGIALLTFARTAWIAVAVQAALYLWLQREKKGEMVKKVKKYLVPIGLVAIVVVGLLAVASFSEEVRGSTLSRLDQARIATFYFLRSPWIGQGLGTFVPTLWQTRAFLLEYGDPLEAHGIIFKLMFEQGILGLITFGIFVGAILRQIKKSGNVPALLIAGGSIAYQLFNTTYYTSKLWVPLAIAVAIARLSEASKASKSGESGA